MEQQKLIITDNPHTALQSEIAAGAYDKIFILADTNTSRTCLPELSRAATPCTGSGPDPLAGATLITTGATDSNKTINSLSHIWTMLCDNGATRRSLLVNLGGGMVSDMGGFAASTFKRGIPFINLPTTLLAMVDASIGGKTGINFNGLKNEIGVFNNADCVIISTTFLKTSDRDNLLSGFAEMLKHGLLSDPAHWSELLAFDICRPDLKRLGTLIGRSIGVKEHIVRTDPHEKNLRKALNLGHTVGHAIESLAMQRTPLLHGYAVAYGLVCELYLSAVKKGFPARLLRQASAFITEHYGRPDITCNDYPLLTSLMKHDKKNTGSGINFTLLGGIGDINTDCTATVKEIEEALDFLREGQ